MVYKFKLVSDEVSNFSREYEIDSNASFLQLRNMILDSVDYSKEDMDSFFLCDDSWDRQEEITLADMVSASDEDIWLMEDTPLNELIEEEGQKLVFVFDYLTDRCFYMEMKEFLPGRSLADPLCTLKQGKAPQQYVDINEMEAAIDAAQSSTPSLDIDEIYDGDHYDDEEIANGFDIDAMS